jgi:hypothetical protein
MKVRCAPMTGKARKLTLLLALGAISLGVAACGSSSSSSSSSKPSGEEGTVASDVIKEAGVYKHVQLTVKNATPEKDDPDGGPWFYLCFTLPNQCGSGDGIKPDPARVTATDAAAKAPLSSDADTATSPDTTGSGGDVSGELGYPPGYGYWTFTAHNPAAARPTIALQLWTTIDRACTEHNQTAPCPTDAHGEWALDEPSAGGKTSQTVNLAGSTFTLERWSDTGDAIVMTIIARGVQ